MKGRFSGNVKLLILSLLAITSFVKPVYSQTRIHDTINEYARVNSIGADNVIINDEIQFGKFAVGDTVLLMQMKGVRIDTLGTGQIMYGQPGKYEFLTISLLDDGTNRVEFMADIVNTSMDVTSDVQLIKVPSYNYAVVDGQLTCQPWDSTKKTGGILAAIIGRTLSLNADIDVTGKGLKGGEITEGQGICISTDLKWDKFYYSAGTDSSGNKGEGLAVKVNKYDGPPYLPVYPGFVKGKGANFNGGGGGNGRFSGGGGGSNYGAGGKGGRENNLCVPNASGGMEGKSVMLTLLKGGFFLGGGGGGSTYQSGGTSVPGGNGGGIIFLICDTLMGNGHSILADGAFPGTASGTAGAGGGGGGGTIALYLQSYSVNTATSTVTISAKGGKGGNNAGNSGEGGGGGGGYINTSNVTIPSNVTKTVLGGTGGTRSGTSTGLNGFAGTDSTKFTPLLNGFLFNSIRSAVTGNQVDSICSNVIPPPITGTNPAGTGPFIYLWQKSYDLSGPASTIAGAILKDYTPTVTEADTVWIRRVVTDTGATPLVITDTSKWVKIFVQPAITGNLVGKDTTICYNQDPLSLIPLNTGPSKGNGIYRYQWIQNSNDTDWSSPSTPSGTSDLASYDPAALTDTTYYKRVVTSGRCIDQSATVTITVLPSITANVTDRPDSVICEGQLFNTLGATTPGGGSGSYVYLWQDSTASVTWTSSPNVNTGTTYTPDTSTFAVTEQRYYRRVVFSGPDSVCRSNSSPILMTRHHYIENNTISKDTTICSGSIPPPFDGSDPEKGSLVYTYQWLSSTDNDTFTNLTAATSRDYQPDTLTDTTWYRRIVNSSKCADTSKILVINVHKPITNNFASLISASGSDTTICSGAVPNKIKGSVPAGGTDIPGDYAYQWSYSTNNSTFTDITAPATGTDYQPDALTDTTWFRRRTISGKCSSESNTIRVIILPVITNNVILSDQTICYGTTPAQITGTALAGGAGGTPTWEWEESTDGVSWLTATGVSSEQNYSPPSLTSPMKYRRIILSGPYDCCINTSEILHIGINPLPTGEITSVTDTTICGGSKVLLDVSLTGASKWKVVYKENSTEVTVDNIAASDTTLKAIPVPTAGMSTFSYSLVSVEDQNNCIATSLTGTRKADVYRVPVAEAGTDDEICGPEYTLAAIPSDGTGTWIFPSEVVESVLTDPATSIRIDSSFTDAYREYKFYWKEINWQCEAKDSVKIKFWNRIDNISAGCDTTLYSFDYKMELNAYPIESFETGEWSVTGGTGSFDDTSENSTFVRGMSKGLNTYMWTVTNGTCIREALINVDIYDMFIPEGFSPNNDPENYNNTFIISGLDLPNQVAELTIVNSAGTEVFHTTNRDNKEWRNWDGRNSNGIEMPEGTYYYILKIVSSESVFKESGFIILKRY